MTKKEKKWWEVEYTVNVYPVPIVTYEAPPHVVYTFESDSDEQSFEIVEEQTTITPIDVVDTDPIIIEPEVVYTFESDPVISIEESTQDFNPDTDKVTITGSSSSAYSDPVIRLNAYETYYAGATIGKVWTKSEDAHLSSNDYIKLGSAVGGAGGYYHDVVVTKGFGVFGFTYAIDYIDDNWWNFDRVLPASDPDLLDEYAEIISAYIEARDNELDTRYLERIPADIIADLNSIHRNIGYSRFQKWLQNKPDNGYNEPVFLEFYVGEETIEQTILFEII